VGGADPALRQGHWEHHLGEALHAQGELEQARRHLEKAVELLGHPFPGSKGSMAFATNGLLARQVANRLAGPRALSGAAAERSLQAARAYDRMLQIFYYGGMEQQMFYATLRTLNLAEQGGPSPELARAYSIAHAVAGVIPVRSLADRYLALAKTTLREAYDSEVDSYLQLLAGVYRTGTAEWSQAREALDRGLELATALGFDRRADEIRLGLANWSYLRGNHGDAARFMAQELPSVREDPQAQAWRLLIRAQVAMAQGSDHEALALARSAAELAQGDRLARSELTWTHAVHGAALWRTGDAEGARLATEKALAGFLAGRPLAFYCIEAYALTAETLIALAADGAPASVSKARQACSALRTFARVFPAALPRALRLEGDLAVVRRRAGAAARLWRQSGERARLLAMATDEVLAERRLGGGAATRSIEGEMTRDAQRQGDDQ
jgi:hypothetical protein